MPTNTIIVDDAQDWGSSVFNGIQNFGSELGRLLPEILAAVLVLIVGLIAAAMLGRLVRRLVIWSRVDAWIEKADAKTGSLQATGLKFKIADIAGALVKWFAILLVISISADILNWTAVTDLLNSFIAYLPNVAAAVLLLVGGYLLGNFVENMVTGMGGATDTNATRVFAGIARWGIFIFATMAALIQLGIAESLIHIAFIGFTAMVALAGGLAFGLGGKDKAGELLSDIKNKTPRVM